NGTSHDDDGNLFMRDSSRVAPHNSYLLFESVYDKAEADGFNVENKQKPLTFLTEEDEDEGEDAQNIQINYAKSGSPVVEFTYDEIYESYLRYYVFLQNVYFCNLLKFEVDNEFFAFICHDIIIDVVY